MITIGRERLTDLDEASRLEWVLGNGLGGYASSTACGMNTRRYHGLLVASANPPVDRFVVLSKIDEEVRQGGEEWLLSTNHYGRAVHPRGHLLLSGFAMNPFPCHTWTFGGNELRKTVVPVQGKNTVVVTWSFVEGKGPITLSLYPLVVYRDLHELTRAPFPPVRSIEIDRGVRLHFEGRPAPLLLVSDRAAFSGKETVHRDLFLPKERERGFDDREDAYVPGHFKIELIPGQSVSVFASIEVGQPPTDARETVERETRRAAESLKSLPLPDEFTARLAWAGRQFLARRATTGAPTIIAGYPWFTDWSRDAMIAAPGLLLCTGRHGDCLDLLRSFAAFEKDGLLPNRFPDRSADPIEYNAIDAPLWFVHACYAYMIHSGDRRGTGRHLLPVAERIVDAYLAGTAYSIRVEEDGLVSGGTPATSLTWMDARVGDEPVTARWGKCVEINALFYNALCACSAMREAVDGRRSARHEELARRTAASFLRLFVRPDGEGLADLVQDGRRDDAIRPNQIFALSLPFTMVTKTVAMNTLATVERHLLTELGLRTLAPCHRHYRGKYRGGPLERDTAYHQGTVWPWLLGPFLTAYCRAHDYSDAALARSRALLEPLRRHLQDAGLGTVSEIADADAPQRPDGCIAQAWSVAEPLRFHVEDLHGRMKKPPFPV